MKHNITDRLTALERSHQAGVVNDEAEATRLFFGRLTDEELDQLQVIVERAEAEGRDELAGAEKEFWEDLLARYGDDHAPD